MKYTFFIYLLNLIILIIIIQLTLSSIQIPSILPVNKIILAEDLNDFYKFTNFRCDLESIGYEIFFNKNSNISLIPINLFERLREFYKSYEDIIVAIQNYENGNEELILYANLEYGLETFHFIFENFGISIPLKYFVTEKKENQRYVVRFLSNENQQNITFGADLINLMNIEFKDENNLIINNEEFISIMDR